MARPDAEPRMHTAEHILNQTMTRMFDCGRCFNAHIERKKSKCDYRFDRALTDEEVAEIERRVNEIVAADMPVSAEVLSREEAERAVDTSLLPKEVEGDVRIVRVGDYDACPCVGEHVASSGEIGGFRVVSTDFREGALRVRFKLAD
jgi:misacylated tRNA(Ala) deacylase